MAPTLKAVKERHDDPKNMLKGDYIEDIFEAWCKFGEETREASDEVMAFLKRTKPLEVVLQRLHDEMADVILCAAMVLSAVEKELNDEN